MIAGKDLSLPVDVHSYRFHRPLCEEVYGIARDQNVKAFIWKQGHEVQDDHLALQKVGIPAIDIIDFDYRHWHRLTDTPAACSLDSFEQVAKVLSACGCKKRSEQKEETSQARRSGVPHLRAWGAVSRTGTNPWTPSASPSASSSSAC